MGNLRLHHERGFTLMELSIVLVIVGLIAAGVMAGRSMIRQAELRRMVRDVEQFNTAVYTFRGKYDCLPGDCQNATMYWPTATNGNGNGSIQEANEVLGFWQMLGSGYAGLIQGNYSGTQGGGGPLPGVDIPASPLIAGWTGYLYRCATPTAPDLNGVYPFKIYGQIICGIWIGNWQALTWNQYLGSGSVSPRETLELDRKFDDGIASSGRIWAVGWYGAGYGCSDHDPVSSATPVTANYFPLSDTAPHCIPIFKTDY